MQSMVCKMVLRAPSRIVPPLCVLDPSGMNTTAGVGVAASNSALCASFKSSTFRANSMTATCKQADLSALAPSPAEAAVPSQSAQHRLKTRQKGRCPGVHRGAC